MQTRLELRFSLRYKIQNTNTRLSRSIDNNNREAKDPIWPGRNAIRLLLRDIKPRALAQSSSAVHSASREPRIERGLRIRCIHSQ